MESPPRHDTTVRFDTSRFPLVRIVFGQEVLPSTVDAIERGYAELFARDQRFAVIIDTRSIRVLPSSQVRWLVIRLLNRPDFHENQCRYQLSSAQLFDSDVVRAAARVVSWARVQPWPVVTPDTEDEAIRFSLERLREAGLLPADSPPLGETGD